MSCASPARWDRIGEGASAESYLAHARDVGIVRDPDFPPDLGQWWRSFQQAAPVDHVGLIAPRPILIIQGENDDVVPPKHASELYACAGEPKEIQWIAGEGHRLRLSKSAMDAAMNWLLRINRMEGPR